MKSFDGKVPGPLKEPTSSPEIVPIENVEIMRTGELSPELQRFIAGLTEKEALKPYSFSIIHSALRELIGKVDVADSDEGRLFVFTQTNTVGTSEELSLSVLEAFTFLKGVLPEEVDISEIASDELMDELSNSLGTAVENEVSATPVRVATDPWANARKKYSALPSDSDAVQDGAVDGEVPDTVSSPSTTDPWAKARQKYSVATEADVVSGEQAKAVSQKKNSKPISNKKVLEKISRYEDVGARHQNEGVDYDFEMRARVMAKSGKEFAVSTPKPVPRVEGAVEEKMNGGLPPWISYDEDQVLPSQPSRPEESEVSVNPWLSDDVQDQIKLSQLKEKINTKKGVQSSETEKEKVNGTPPAVQEVEPKKENVTILSPVTPPSTPEKVIPTLSPEAIVSDKKFFDTRFETELGMSKEKLLKVAGFEKLAEGQQKLVFENLKSVVTSEKGSFIRKVMTKYIDADLDGFAQPNAPGKHQKLVERLVGNVNETNVKVHERVNGTLRPDFVNFEFNRAGRGTQWNVVQTLNRAAYRLLDVPEDWKGERAKQRASETKMGRFLKDKLTNRNEIFSTYEAREKEYAEAKEALAKMFTDSGMSPQDAAKKMLEMESRISTLRFVHSSPDAVRAVQQGATPETIAQVSEALAKNGKNTKNAPLGNIETVATAEAVDVLVAPAVAEVIKATEAPKTPEVKDVEKVNEETKLSEVKGEESLDTETEAGIVQAVRFIGVEGTQKDRGFIAKLDGLITSFKMVEEETGADNVKKRNELLTTLNARVLYGLHKIKTKEINFASPSGMKHEEALNAERFYSTLAYAQEIISEHYNTMPKSAIEHILKKRLKFMQKDMPDETTLRALAKHASETKRQALAIRNASLAENT